MKKSDGTTKSKILDLQKSLQEKEHLISLQEQEIRLKQFELEESRDKYADLFDYAPGGYIILDDKGVIKDLNASACEMLGNKKGILVNLPLITCLSDQDILRFQKLLRNVIKNFTAGTGEFTTRNENTPLLYLHMLVSPIRNYINNSTELRVSVTDITPRKKAENALRESESRFRNMADSAPVMVWLSNENMDLIYANKSLLGFYGKKLDEINKKKWASLLHPDDINRFLETIDKSVKEKNSFSIEIRVLNHQNEYAWVLKSAAPRFTYDGKFNGFIGSEIDITEKKKQRLDLEQALTEKEILLKEIHHRIKNNLQIISSLLNLQLNYLENEEIIELLKSSQSRIRSMALIHEKLYKTKELSRINFAEYTREFTTFLFQAYRKKIGNVRLELDLADVMLDINLSLSLGLILNELMTNTLKHAFPDNRDGKVKIYLREEKSQIELVISDDGVGLPDNFEIKNNNSLGLELVDSLIEQHKGKLSIKKKDQTEFRITVNKNGAIRTPKL